jgi:hypothetical protein
MKKPIIVLLYIGLFIACSSGGSDDLEFPSTPSPAPEENNAPSVPSLVSPTNELKCTETSLDFSWNASTDPDKDDVSYNIQIATNNSFNANLQVLSTSKTSANFTLLKGVAYYWRVNASDTKKNASAYSPIWKFYSEGNGVSNHLPYAASLVSPLLNAEIDNSSTTLQWSASDADDDPLTYDVYFGTDSSPALVAASITETTYNVNLVAATTYYWKIVVKDDARGEAIGQVWTFSTE